MHLCNTRSFYALNRTLTMLIFTIIYPSYKLCSFSSSALTHLLREQCDVSFEQERYFKAITVFNLLR